MDVPTTLVDDHDDEKMSLLCRRNPSSGDQMPQDKGNAEAQKQYEDNLHQLHKCAVAGLGGSAVGRGQKLIHELTSRNLIRNSNGVIKLAAAQQNRRPPCLRRLTLLYFGFGRDHLLDARTAKPNPRTD